MEEKKRKAVYNREADKRWREKNKEQNKYINYRSQARVFLRDLIREEDLAEFQALLKSATERFK